MTTSYCCIEGKWNKVVELEDGSVAEMVPVGIDEVPIETLITAWDELILELSNKEAELIKLKYTIFDKEQWIVENTDFKQVYGKNNSDVRKLHFQKHMKHQYDLRDDLEISIDYLKRRISFLKTVLYLKGGVDDGHIKKEFS